jgi:hypothetical protein
MDNMEFSNKEEIDKTLITPIHNRNFERLINEDKNNNQDGIKDYLGK